MEARLVSPVKLHCTFCHGAVPRDEAVNCAACLALHHAECHAEHGRCAIHGCGERRVLVARGAAPRSRLLVAALVFVATALALVAGLGRSGPSAEAIDAMRPTPRTPTPRPTSVRSANEVVLLASDLHVPVQLAAGERLIVSARDDGYTRAVLERGAGREDRTVLVAEPGERVVLRVDGTDIIIEPGQVLAFEGGMMKESD